MESSFPFYSKATIFTKIAIKKKEFIKNPLPLGIAVLTIVLGYGKVKEGIHRFLALIEPSSHVSSFDFPQQTDKTQEWR